MSAIRDDENDLVSYAKEKGIKLSQSSVGSPVTLTLPDGTVKQCSGLYSALEFVKGF